MNAKLLLALRIALVIAFAAVLFSVPQPVLAADCQWTGGTDTDWNKAGNWKDCGGNVPGASDTATIPDVTNKPIISSAVTLNGLTVNSGSSVTIGGGATLTLTGNVNVGNSGTITGVGTFRTQGTVSLQVWGPSGIVSAPFEVNSGTTTAFGTFGGTITIDSGATLLVAWADTITANDNVTVNGTLSGASGAYNFSFNGTTFTNNGAVTVYETDFNGGTQSIVGTGTWTGNRLFINSPSNTSLANPVTFGVGDIRVNSGGKITGTNVFHTAGTPQLWVNGGTFSAPFEVSAGTTTASGTFGGTITIDKGATLCVTGSDTISANNNVTVSGTLNGKDSASTFSFSGATFTNNGVVTVFWFVFLGSAQTLTGSGSFSSNNVQVESGSTVTLNSNHQMNNLVLHGGNLDISNHTLSLSGAGVTIYSGIFTTTGSTIVYNGSVAQTVATDNVTFNNLTIDNAAGATLAGSTQVGGTLWLKSGDLNTGTYNTLTMGSTSAQATGSYDVVGNVTRTAFNQTSALTFGSPNTSLLFSYTDAPTNATVTLVKDSPGGLTNYVKRKYTISITGGTGVSANVRLHYQSPGDLVGIANENNLKLWRYDSSRWVLQGGTAGGTGTLDGYVEKSGVNTFSDWAISDNGAPTAVTLGSFSARSQSSDLPVYLVLGGIGTLMLAVFGIAFAQIRRK